MFTVAEALTVIVSVMVVDPPFRGVAEVDESLHVTPGGHPVTVKPTAELKPFRDLIATFEVPDVLSLRLSLFGDAEIEKSGGGAVTVRLTVVE